MYPSIDIEEIMKIVNMKIEEKFSINKISEILISTGNLVINEGHFAFGSIYYRQKRVLLLKLPISSILAEMKLRILEE